MGLSATDFLEKKKKRGLSFKQSLQRGFGETYIEDVERFSKNYEDDYVASYRSQEELENYYGDLKKLTDQTRSLRSYIQHYGTDEQKKTLGDIDSAISSYEQALAEKDTTMSRYSGFANANEYNAAVAENQAKIERENRLQTPGIQTRLEDQLYRLRADRNRAIIAVDFSEISRINDEIKQIKRDMEDAEKLQQNAKDMALMSNEDFGEFSVANPEVLATLYRQINGLDPIGTPGTPYEHPDSLGQTSVDRTDSYTATNFAYDYLTDDERGVYNYLYREDPARAQAFLDNLDQTLATRIATETLGIGQEHPVLGSALSVVLNLAAPFEQIVRTFDGKTNQMANLSTALRFGASSNMGGVGSFFYNTGMSMADSVLAALMPTGVGAGMLGLSAAAQTQNDIIQRGGTTEEALIGGVAAGIFEAFFENFSIGQLQSMKPTEMVKDWKVFGANVLKGMGVNASEEAATELANILADETIMGNLSNASIMLERYMAQGMSEEEAKKKVFGNLALQVGEAAASGALMGFGFSALGGGVGVTQRTVAGNQIVKHDSGEQTKVKTLIKNADEVFSKGEEYAEQRALLEEVKTNLGKNNLNQKARIGTLYDEYLKATYKNSLEDIPATVKKVQQSASAAIIGGKNADVVYEHLPEIVEFTDMTGDAIMVKGKDGETVSLSSLSLQDEELAQLYAYATTLGSVDAANSFLSSFELEMDEGTVTATEFWSDWIGIQSMGQTLGTEKARAEAFATYGGSYMSDTVKTAAFLAGVNLRTATRTRKIEAAEAYKKAWRESGGEVKQGKFDDSAIKDKLKNKEVTEEQRQFVDFSRVFSDVFGVNVKFFASKLKNGKRSVENGRYDPKTNTIYLDIYAGVGENIEATTACLINTLSHEVVHNMAVNAPTEYFALRDYVVAYLAEKEAFDLESKIQEKIDAYAAIDKNITHEEALEEIVANACEDMLGSSETVREFMEGFYAKNKKAAEKFSDTIKKILENLKEFFATILGRKSDSAEAKAVREAGAEIISEIQKRFDSGILAMREGNMARNSAEMQKTVTSYEENGGALSQERNRLSNSDLSEYLKAGGRANKSKVQALSQGKQIILTNDGEIISFIDRSIKKEKGLPTVAYGNVTARLAADVKEYSDGKIQIDGNYLELVPDDISHAYVGHLQAKQEGDIDLTKTDFEKIPEYIDNYDDLVYAIQYQNGNTRICLSKKVSQGRVLLIETVSKSRSSLQFKNMIGVSESKYLSDYESKYKKRNRSNSRGSESSNISLHDESASNDSIAQKSEKSSENAKKILEESGTELSQFRIETPEPSQVLADLFADKEAYAGYAEHKKDLVAYRNMQTIVAAKEKEIAEIDKNIARLRSEHRQSGKGSRMDDLHQQKKRAEDTIAEYKKRMFAMEAKELRAIVDAETRKAVDRMQKEQSEKYRAKSRERTERMRMSERRTKLKKIVKELDSLLNRGNKKKNVKEGLQETVASALKLANLLLTDELSNADIVMMGNVDSFTDQEEKYLHEYRALLLQKEALEKELSEMGDELQEEESFSAQVDAVLGGKDTMSTHLRVGETPALLRKAGLPSLPILMTAKHLKTITGESGDDGRNYHGLDIEIVKRLPEYLSDPVLIADSLTRDDSIVVLTEAVDSQNRPVIAAIKLQGRGQHQNKYIDANIMTSAYGKDNIQSFLQKIADASATIYWNEKKSQDMSVNLGVQFPNIITSLDSNTIIRRAKAFVKTNAEKGSKNYDAFDRKMDAIAKVDHQIKLLDRELKNLFEREKNRANRTQIATVLDELSNAYKGIQKSDEEYLRQAYSEYVADRIDALKDAEVFKGVSVKRMTEAQLQEIYDLYVAVLKTVKDANKAFRAEFSETVTELAEMLGVELRASGKEEDKVWRVKQWIRSFSWKMLLPTYAVDIIGAQTLKKLFYGISEAEGIWARDIREGQEFKKAMDQKYKSNDWNFDKQHTFHDKFGKEFSLTLDQILSIYAHTRQGQDAENHLDVGGITQSKLVKVKKENGLWTYTWNTSKTYRLSPEIRAGIISKLTEEQKHYAEEMQAYLSDVLGEKGNEVSRKLYGIRIFNKKIYFPLRSATQYIAEKKDSQTYQKPKLINLGMTKERADGASSPIVLDGFRDVWASHTAEMASYHAFTLPLEDFSRVFNYGRRGDNDNEASAVQATMETVFGSQAVTYFNQLIDQLNGAVRVDNTAGFANKFVSLAKTGATAASLSTLIQQPTAMFRAMAMIDPKYFLTHAKFGKGHKKEWAELKKYAPIAQIKEMGGYDTGLGAKTTDWIKAPEYQSIKEKGKALITDSSYRNEKIFALPALADELSWCHIWAAVKKEVSDKSDWKVGSEEFLQACGERFTDVVMHTQVYDSVLARSALMRSKDGFAKVLTAFAAEPTVFSNMVAYGILAGKRGDKKMAARFIGSSVASMMINAAVVALVYAARDDDEDETYSEKYIQSLTTELIEGFNPITYIPFLRDIWSTFLGYDVERMDMSLFADFSQSLEGLWSTRKTPWKKWTDFVGDLAKIFGIPIGNLLRDGTATFRLIQMFMEGKIAGNSDDLFDAFVDGAKDSVPLLDRFVE